MPGGRAVSGRSILGPAAGQPDAPPLPSPPLFLSTGTATPYLHPRHRSATDTRHALGQFAAVVASVPVGTSAAVPPTPGPGTPPASTEMPPRSAHGNVPRYDGQPDQTLQPRRARPWASCRLRGDTGGGGITPSSARMSAKFRDGAIGRIIRAHMRLAGAFRDNAKLLGSLKSTRSRLDSGTACVQPGHLEQCDYSRASQTIWDQSGSLELTRTIWDCPRPSRTIPDHRGPVGSSGWLADWRHCQACRRALGPTGEFQNRAAGRSVLRHAVACQLQPLSRTNNG